MNTPIPMSTEMRMSSFHSKCTTHADLKRTTLYHRCHRGTKRLLSCKMTLEVCYWRRQVQELMSLANSSRRRRATWRRGGGGRRPGSARHVEYNGHTCCSGKHPGMWFCTTGVGTTCQLRCQCPVPAFASSRGGYAHAPMLHTAQDDAGLRVLSESISFHGLCRPAMPVSVNTCLSRTSDCECGVVRHVKSNVVMIWTAHCNGHRTDQ